MGLPEGVRDAPTQILVHSPERKIPLSITKGILKGHSGRLNDFSLVRLPRGNLALYLNKQLARRKDLMRKLEKLHPLSRTVRLRQIATVHGSLRRFSTFRRLCDR